LYGFSMIDLALAIVPQIETSLGCIIAVDAAILEEAAIRAEITIRQIAIHQPNELKQAGHYAFWIRKLKPLKIVDLVELRETIVELEKLSLIKGSIDQVQSIQCPSPDASMFINELFAIVAAIAICRTGKFTVNMETQAMHDLATTLRYSSFSPTALSAILQAYASKLQ
jgi:hypothetical protein